MRRGIARIVPMVMGGIVLAVLLAFLFGLAVKALWNWLMPDIFGLPQLGYWQGVGLVLLGHMLFGGGFRFGDHHGRCERGEEPHGGAC
jgi:hypothetical protein